MVTKRREIWSHWFEALEIKVGAGRSGSPSSSDELPLTALMNSQESLGITPFTSKNVAALKWPDLVCFVNRSRRICTESSDKFH